VTFPSPPAVSDGTLEETGWTAVSEDKEKTTKEVLGAFEFGVYMYTKKYERDDGDGRDGVFFVNKTRTDPSPAGVPLGVGEDRVASIVMARGLKTLKDELRERGAHDITVEEETKSETPTGEPLELERITATYENEKTSGWVGAARREEEFLTAGGVSTVKKEPEEEVPDEEIRRLVESVV
jgi:hypothetical protein